MSTFLWIGLGAFSLVALLSYLSSRKEQDRKRFRASEDYQLIKNFVRKFGRNVDSEKMMRLQELLESKKYNLGKKEIGKEYIHEIIEQSFETIKTKLKKALEKEGQESSRESILRQYQKEFSEKLLEPIPLSYLMLFLEKWKNDELDKPLSRAQKDALETIEKIHSPLSSNWFAPDYYKSRVEKMKSTNLRSAYIKKTTNKAQKKIFNKAENVRKQLRTKQFEKELAL